MGFFFAVQRRSAATGHKPRIMRTWGFRNTTLTPAPVKPGPKIAHLKIPPFSRMLERPSTLLHILLCPEETEYRTVSRVSDGAIAVLDLLHAPSEDGRCSLHFFYPVQLIIGRQILILSLQGPSGNTVPSHQPAYSNHPPVPDAPNRPARDSRTSRSTSANAYFYS